MTGRDVTLKQGQAVVIGSVRVVAVGEEVHLRLETPFHNVLGRVVKDELSDCRGAS